MNELAGSFETRRVRPHVCDTPWADTLSNEGGDCLAREVGARGLQVSMGFGVRSTLAWILCDEVGFLIAEFLGSLWGVSRLL